MRNTPEWLRILTPETTRAFPKLHAGESSAIQLALQTRAGALVIDDLHGRRVALDLGIDCLGTIGILEEAANLGLVDLDASFKRLRTTNFFASEALLAAALARHLKRRG
jgi:predicted nucleic acid-binding protein